MSPNRAEKAASPGSSHVPEIVTPSFTLVKPTPKKKAGGSAKRKLVVDEPEEDLSDAYFSKTHEVYEKMERELHASFLKNKQARMLLNYRVDESSALPDAFVVRFDKTELPSDPLPPPPRVLRPPARFRDGLSQAAAQAASAATSSSSASASSGTGARKRRVVVAAPREPVADPESLLPVKVGNLKLLSLGRLVTDRPPFQTERVLFPIGFRAEREYVSTVNPLVKTIYLCEILDGERGPRFRVTPADDKKRPIQSESATSCWTEVTNRINAARHALGKKPSTSTISGLDYFGLTRDRVASLLEQLPNANQCRTYQFRFFNPHTGKLLGPQTFERIGPRRKKQKKRSHKKGAAAAEAAAAAAALATEGNVDDGADGDATMAAGPVVLSPLRNRPRKYPGKTYKAKKDSAKKAKRQQLVGAAEEAADGGRGADEAPVLAPPVKRSHKRKVVVAPIVEANVEEAVPREVITGPLPSRRSVAAAQKKKQADNETAAPSPNGKKRPRKECAECRSTSGDVVACSRCSVGFHSKCCGAGVVKPRDPSSWVCPRCVSGRGRRARKQDSSAAAR